MSALRKNLIYLTPQGLTTLRAELKDLRTTKRIELAQKFHQALEFETSEENAEFDAVVEEQSLLENRIAEIEKIIREATVIDGISQTTDTVSLGSTVIVEIGENMDEFTIVGRTEANPSLKKISNESPVGAALLGAKKGAVVEVITPISSYKCKLIEIK